MRIALTAKVQEDWEPIQQHAISSVTECHVQMLAHRKQGPVLPTLVMCISPDPATDKLRKRRSSRTAGLTTTKETHPTTLWFRSCGEEHTLHEWARVIQPLIQPRMPDHQHPLSPASPATPAFSNPFASKTREAAEHFYNQVAQRNGLQQKGSSHSKDRPLTYSESPSLRSKRSDISSHNSSMNPAYGMYGKHPQGHPGAHPADLPSPATTVGEYQGDFIEGWTAAQGRASAVGSPVLGRESVDVPPPMPTESSSPLPSHRETILDRAFNLKCIPGSEQAVPGEEKLTSLARFDALMRQNDEKRRTVTATPRQAPPPKSGWDLDDSDEDEDDKEDEEMIRAAADEPLFDHDGVAISASAQRALDFIANRHEPLPSTARPSNSRAPLPYAPPAPETSSASAANGSTYLRPNTGYSKNRPNMGQRTSSQPHLVPSALDVPSSSTANSAARGPYDDNNSTANASTGGVIPRSNAEKRLSTSSTKRLSFTEFTKRLSSTSSLLLVQTNQSGSSSRGSSEIDASHHNHHHHASQSSAASTAYNGGSTVKSSNSGGLNPRGMSPMPPPHQQQQHPHPLHQHPATATMSDKEREAWEKRCGWRGSVGVFGSEGGFL